MTHGAKPMPQLTKKQRDVLALVADNRTSKEIAARLGISESAVNQRIEMVRARLGGLPRGELARLYRQKYSPNDLNLEESLPTWQKIHLPNADRFSKEGLAESIPPSGSDGSRLAEPDKGDGSRLTAVFFQPDDTWLWRDDRATALVRFGMIAAIVGASLAIAFAVTNFLGPVGG
ncbi:MULTISPECIES: helix-turn-helix transcriptional regulator [unclassified Novosphingobium]|uniref:helix-turn-helix domain-containing protein n=1 Tax=unclassified Novosphingobium TaxID=2644732 RepID=UPI0025CB79BE|nr:MULTISPECIES: helix-turn-helix transcriptional regulator [unclassified Novosphingobium]HQV02610.1 helix-turn-helix transcriptional regulator [Novosphingobium sp.]